MQEPLQQHPREPEAKEPNRRPRVTKRGGLFVNDTELLERLGIPEKEGRETLRCLDGRRDSGFPRKDPFWGHRRYWPAVQAWLDKSQGVAAIAKAREVESGRR